MDYEEELEEQNIAINKYKEKQQLISFLEEKIKEYKLCFPTVVKVLQEVLNFVNKGGKE